MKKYIAGVITGVILSCTAAFAVSHNAEDNVFPILLNGESTELAGYNVEGYTYFKLRDIADKIGGFEVDFRDDTILLSKDGYVYPEKKTVTVTEDMKSVLEEYCLRIPKFTQSSLTTTSFADDFIFYFYTRKTSGVSKRTNDLYYGWTVDEVRTQFKEIFGCDMPNTQNNLENGYYWVHVSDFGDIDYVYDSAADSDSGTDVTYKIMSGDGSVVGYTTLHLVRADNAAGYIIESKS